MTAVERTCAECGDVFHAEGRMASRRKYCSNRCKWRALDKAKIASHQRDCEWCGHPFNCLPHSPQRVCSAQCSHNLRRTGWSEPWPRERRRTEHKVICNWCGHLFTSATGERSCSLSCRAAHRTSQHRRGGWVVGVDYIECAECGREAGRPVGSKFCSSSCARRAERRTAMHRRRSQIRDGEHFTLREIGERDDWLCHLCGYKVKQPPYTRDIEDATLDHVVPLSRGGAHTRTNVRIAHLLCNSYKGADPPAAPTAKGGVR